MQLNQEHEQELMPFGSLSDLRATHVILMRDVRKEGRVASTKRVAEFLQRVEATGAVIENENDRDSAQGVLDYWAAWQFTSENDASLSATPPTLAEFVPTKGQPKPTHNPFVGLRAFEEKDSGNFIGREEATRNLLQKIRAHPIVFVSGPLGSGKSSLVFSGVVPRLSSRGVLETKTEPVFPVVIPGSDPLTTLLRAILQLAITKPANGDAWTTDNRTKLMRSPTSLGAIVESVMPATAVVLIVDQFEEVFTLCEDVASRDAFVKAVATFAENKISNRVILIIRDDYAQRSYALESLKRFGKDIDTHFSPPPLTSAELVRIIGRTAEAAKIRFEDGIIEDLARDVAGDPASLPTLQFTLSRLWATLPADSNRITRDIYRMVGKPRAALAPAAAHAFNRLTPEQQVIAQKIFLELVEPGLGDEIRRRRVPRDSLARLTRESETNIASVLKRFEDAELIRRTDGPDADSDRFEVAHESLVRNWRRLEGWLEFKRQHSAKVLQLIAAARLWQESGRKPGYLIAGSALADATKFRDSSPEINEFIIASERAQLWQTTRRITIVAIVLFCFAVTATVFAFWALGERSVALDQRKIAQKNLLGMYDAVGTFVNAIQQQISANPYSPVAANLLGTAVEILESLDKTASADEGPESIAARGFLMISVVDIYVAKSDPVRALEFARKAKRLAIRLVEMNPDSERTQRLLFMSSFRIGDALAELDRNQNEALEEYRVSLDSATRLASYAPKVTERQFNIAFVRAKICDLHLFWEEWTRAEEECQAVREIYERLQQQEPKDARWVRGTATTLIRIGDIKKAQSSFDDASKNYQSAISMLTGLPKEMSYLSNLSNAYNRLAALFLETDRFNEALTQYNLALEIRLRLAKENSSSTFLQNAIGRQYVLIADALVRIRTDDISEAATFYGSAMRVQEELVDSSPNNLVLLRSLADTYHKFADALTESKQFEQAEPLYYKARAFRAKLVESMPENFERQYDLVTTNFRIGDLLRAQGRRSDALRVYTETLEQVEAIMVQHSTTPRWDKVKQSWESTRSDLQNAIKNLP